MTPDGTATNATAVQNELSMKRIELKSKYMSAIETSVLQIIYKIYIPAHRSDLKIPSKFR